MEKRTYHIFVPAGTPAKVADEVSSALLLNGADTVAKTMYGEAVISRLVVSGTDELIPYVRETGWSWAMM